MYNLIQKAKYQSSRGFTLVELSLVLVIVAVLIAGVITGSSLIKSAQLNSVISDFRNYQTAYNSFITKYGAVAGDFKDASSFWSATCVSSGSSVSCNGDGDGLINNVGVVGTAADDSEVYKAWRHLALAGMVNAGISPLPIPILTIQNNAPGGKIDGSGYFMIGESIDLTSGMTPKSNPFADGVTNAVFVGGQNSSNVLGKGVLSPEEAYNLDKRIDDGVVVVTSGTNNHFSGYDTGIVRAINGDGGTLTTNGCISTTAASTYGYLVSNTLKNCVIGMSLN